MKRFALALLGVMSIPQVASADETVVVKTLKPVVVVGRVAKPNVVIEITRPTAAREAGAAHESLRLSLAR